MSPDFGCVKQSGGQATGTTLELRRGPAVVGLLEGWFGLGFRAWQGVAMRLTDNRCCCCAVPDHRGLRSPPDYDWS